MQNLYLITILLAVVAAIVPVTFAADNNCTVLTKQEDCCAKTTDTDQPTKLCQFVKCNATDTGACYLKSEQQKCGEANATDSCPPAPAGSTTQAPGSTQANSTAAPNPSTTPADTCTGKNQSICCAKDSKCQYVTCSGASSTSGCYPSSKNLTDICTTEGSTGTNLCKVTTSTASPATAPPAPESSTNNNATTTPAPAPPTCNGKNQTACCAANATCQFVNCTDLSDATKVHQGCHSKDDVLTQFCVNNTWTNLCAPPASPTQTPTSSTAKPTGGAPQPAKGGDGGKRQGFDAASFIGGIVLCAGIVAIIFFGLKFYKARTERNYHTLH